MAGGNCSTPVTKSVTVQTYVPPTPNPPENLVVTFPTPDNPNSVTGTATWSPPSSGPTPDYYTVSVSGGQNIQVTGTSTPITATPGTQITVSVASCTNS